MQVTETTSEGLKREIQIVIGSDELEQRLLARLNELKDQVRIKGFRPGKVPVNHLRKVHGRAVMADIVRDTVNETSQKALEDRDERPATQPEIKLTEDTGEMEDLVSGKIDLAYTMSFEVVPPIEMMDFSKLELERPVTEVGEQEIDETVERIRSQQRGFETKDGKAENGDRVTIDFVGSVDGAQFDGGSATDAPLELGTGSFIPGFEEQLIGVKAGDTPTVKVSFPEDYQVDTLAGREAEFAVTVKEVAAPQETEIDDDFAKRLGLESVQQLRENISQQIATEYARVSTERLKRQVLDAIDEKHDMELPQALVEQEFELIWNRVNEEMQRSGQTFEDEDTTEDQAREDYRKIAERRVKLGLVLGEVGRKQNVEVTEEELNHALMQQVQKYPGQEQAVYDLYQKNPAAIAELRGPVFEQKVVDYIASQANVTDKTVSREELLADPDEEPEEKPKKKKASAKAKSGAAKSKSEAGKGKSAKPKPKSEAAAKSGDDA